VVQRDGVTVTSNGRFKVKINEIQDHSYIPDYPHTSQRGILHFIAYAQPIFSADFKDKTLKEQTTLVRAEMQKIMSRVSHSAYVQRHLS
jgi:hypothetical protein